MFHFALSQLFTYNVHSICKKYRRWIQICNNIFIAFTYKANGINKMHVLMLLSLHILKTIYKDENGE